MKTSSCLITTLCLQIRPSRTWGRWCVIRSSDQAFPTSGRAVRWDGEKDLSDVAACKIMSPSPWYMIGQPQKLCCRQVVDEHLWGKKETELAAEGKTVGCRPRSVVRVMELSWTKSFFETRRFIISQCLLWSCGLRSYLVVHSPK